MAWEKSIKLQKLSAPKLLKVLFADRGNPSTIRRLVFSSWRSYVHSERTKELLPMSDVWHKKADALEITLTKESSIKKQRKKELKLLQVIALQTDSLFFKRTKNHTWNMLSFQK
jgi:hypothetical protein